MIIQIDCLSGKQADEVVTTVLDREDQDCKDVVQVTQHYGSVSREESLADDRDRVEERSVE